MPCAGNSSQHCGAASRINVYKVGTCSSRPIVEPYCDSALPISARVEDLLGRLSLEQKIACMTDELCTLPEMGIYMASMWAESLHGLRYPCGNVLGSGASPKCATSFPHAQLLAATFNRSAWHSVGDGISTEARAFHSLYNRGQMSGAMHALSFFAPDVNLCRDPRWGRCVEVAGEDPWLSAEYARQYVRGMQQEDERGFVKALVNLKHFSSYDVEAGFVSQGAGPYYGRTSFNAEVQVRDLLEFYLAHFRTIARTANPAGAMCSYNAESWTPPPPPPRLASAAASTRNVSGHARSTSAARDVQGALPTTYNVPSCANSVFTNEVLRGPDYNFTGMVVSDCSAVAGIFNAHHFANTTGATVLAALTGGTDLNCGTFYQDYAGFAVGNGTVGMDLVDTAVRRVLTQLFRAGTAERTPVWDEYGVADIDSPRNRQLALETATQGMVLLKNDGGVLPLQAGSRVALIGPHVNSSTEMLGNYYGSNNLVFDHTPLLALQRRPDLDVVAFAEGCALAGNDTTGFDAAKRAAQAADVVVLFVGLTSGQGAQVNNTPAMEREGFDRTFLTLPAIQQNLTELVLATGKPVVAVLMNSGGLAATTVYGGAQAVLEAFYPGELGGDAIASVLMGDTPPAGRMPTSIYPAEYTAARNITDMVLRPHSAPDGTPIPGVTHRYMSDAELLYPFGYGESYTSFELSPIGAWQQTVNITAFAAQWDSYYSNPDSQDGLPTFTVQVRNTGATHTSDFVVLGMATSLTDPNAPVRQLFSFDRVSALQPGQAANVTLAVAPQAVTSVPGGEGSGTEQLVPGKWAIRLGGAPQGFINGTLTLQGPAATMYQFPSGGVPTVSSRLAESAERPP